jgi:hypothetical protein
VLIIRRKFGGSLLERIPTGSLLTRKTSRSESHLVM